MMMGRPALLVVALGVSRCFSQEMRAWVASPDGSSRLETVPRPTLGRLHEDFASLPSACEALVEVYASSVNPVDRTFKNIAEPRTMGSDLSGVVVALGRGCEASHLSVGLRVWADIGANVKTRDGEGTKENGAYAEFALALDSQVGAMPSAVSFAEAAALPKVSLTSLKALTWYAPPLESATVVVLGGSGGTGSTGIQIAKALGAARVVATTSAANVDYCRGIGADVVVDYKARNWTDVVADGSVDVVYDTVGQAGPPADAALEKLRGPNASYVSIAGGAPTARDPRAKQFINSDTNLDNVALLDALAALVDAGKLRMSHIDSTYALGALDAAFTRSATGRVAGKVAVAIKDGSCR